MRYIWNKITAFKNRGFFCFPTLQFFCFKILVNFSKKFAIFRVYTKINSEFFVAALQKFNRKEYAAHDQYNSFVLPTQSAS
jgi:hypothetical protein